MTRTPEQVWLARAPFGTARRSYLVGFRLDAPFAGHRFDVKVTQIKLPKESPT